MFVVCGDGWSCMVQRAEPSTSTQREREGASEAEMYMMESP